MKISNFDKTLEQGREPDFLPISIAAILSAGGKIDRTLSILKRELRRAFEGGVKSGIYIQPADCGAGKSSAAQSAIAAWCADGFPGRGSIIVAVATLAEIDAYVAGCKLDQHHYSVFTSNHGYNGYGLGRDRAADARVLFTTHEQLRRRLQESGSFAAADCFLFKGVTRNAIIWDEGLVAALPASFDLSALAALPDALRSRSSGEKRAFEALVPDRSDRVVGGSIAVPTATAKLARDIALDKSKLNERSRQTLDALAKLGDGRAYLTGDGDKGLSCIGRGTPLPSDLPPTFVLDASARLTGNYDNLHRYGFKVVQMQPASVSYANLSIRWWDKGCGKTTLAKPEDRNNIVKVIAALINEQPNEEWLIVHAKAFGKEVAGVNVLPDDLTDKLHQPDKVKSVTWGRHLGSNAFRDARNVIVLGSYNYNDAAYEAQHLAVSGQSGGIVTKEQRGHREGAEFMHNIYQAVCRSRIRQHIDGTCLPATAYFIMRRSDHRQRLVERAFEGCAINAWQPVEPKRTRKFDLITAAMMSMFETRTVITKAGLIEQCGGSGKSYLDKIFRSEEFKKFAAVQGITLKGVNIYKAGLLKAA